MDKDSFEYRSWRASLIGLALIIITMVACMAIFVAIFAPKEPHMALSALILGMIIWSVAAVSSYSSAQAMYQKRMSGWTPLEGFFTSRLIKLVQKIRGKDQKP